MIEVCHIIFFLSHNIISLSKNYLFRQRNRNHAKKSRQRKKALTVLLQESVEELKRENLKLREEVNAIIGHRKAEAIIAEKRERSRQQFLSALMDPKNRVLDTSGLAFMKNLRKNLPNEN